MVVKNNCQMWSPRGRHWPRGHPHGHILKSLALALKVKFLALASKPQVLENWPVLGSKTALFFEWLKFCKAAEKFFSTPFFSEIARKKFLKTLKKIFEDLFFGEHMRLRPWSLALASRISVLGKAVLGLVLGFFCVLGLGLELRVLDSTSDCNCNHGYPRKKKCINPGRGAKWAIRQR